MAWMPGARRRPISRNYKRRVTNKDCIILHSTGVNNTVSQYGWFNTRGAGASSHFHIDFDGNIEQYIDTAYISYANSAANSRSVTIETQGNGYGPWTAAQIRSIVRIIQWVRSVHKGIPLRQMTSSLSSQKGIGWHRLGCDGNFPRTGILRGRNQRGVGQKWTKHYGKICPGDDRIKQIPAIIRQAGGHSTPATAATPTTPKPKAQPKGSWFDMASKQDLIDAINSVNIPQRIMDSQIPVQRSGRSQFRRLGTLIQGQDAAHNRFAADLAALREVVSQLATGQGVTIDYDKVQEAAKAGAAAAIQAADQGE